MICTEKKIIRIGPYTEVEVGCGLDEAEHGSMHLTRDTHDEVIVTFRWAGEFKGEKEDDNA